MAILKPIAQNLSAFDATKDQKFVFISTGGDQVVKNKLTIRDNSNNSVVYEHTVESYAFEQILPANTLTNGTYYNFYFNTYNANNDKSPDSNSVGFYCYTTPLLEFDNISQMQRIETSTYTFDISYSQQEGELVNNISVYLYDEANRLIDENNNLSIVNNKASYTYSGFEDMTGYKIQAKCITVNDTEVYTDMIQFSVLYNNPMLHSTLELTNKCNEGYVRIQSSLISVDGYTNPRSPIKYVGDKTEILGVNSYVQWKQGFTLNSDFIVSTWFGFGVEGEILRFEGSDSSTYMTVEFLRRRRYNDNSIVSVFAVVSVYVDGVLKLRKRSNYIGDSTNRPTSNQTPLFLWIKKNGNIWDVVLSTIGELKYNNSINWTDISHPQTDNTDYNRLTSGEDMGWEDYTLSPLNYEENFLIEENNYVNGNVNNDIFPIDIVTVRNGVYDHFNVTTDLSKTYTTDKPTVWDDYTVLDCSFDNTINAGREADITLYDLSSIKIKRRKLGEKWVTINNISVENMESLDIDVIDSFIPTNTYFEYAIVPIRSSSIEGNYITASIITKLNGCFLSTKNKIFKLYEGVTYGGNTQATDIGTLQPIGNKYPIIVQNGAVNYQTGTIGASIYGYNFETTRRIDRQDVIRQSNDLMQFLTSGECMCYSDWNGNIWLIRCNASPQLNYNPTYGNGTSSISFSFVEQGQYNNQEDLYNNGFVDVIS